MIVNNTSNFKTNFSKFIQDNKTLISFITVLYVVPLYTTNNFSPLRSLLNQITLVLIFGIFALSFELQLGRTGLLNFGQAVFFGVGAYGLAFSLDYIATLPSKHVLFYLFIPNFLFIPESSFYLILPSLPHFVVIILQNAFIQVLIAFAIAILMGALLGFIMGLTTNKMRGITFAFIALAIAMLFYAYSSQTPEGSAISGGDTGKKVIALNLFQSLPLYLIFVVLTLIILILFIAVIYHDLKERRGIFGISLFASPLDNSNDISLFQKNRNIIKGVIFAILIIIIAYFIFFVSLPNILGMVHITSDTYFFTIPINYYFVLTCAVLMYIFSKKLTQSPFGRVLAGISQNEQRVQALGYNVYRYKIKALTISGAMGGLAGALYAVISELLTPETTFSVDTTVNVMIYSIVGGLNTLFGPFIGTAFVISSESPHDTSLGILATILNHYNISTDMILVVIGLIYIIIVIFLPFGISGTFQVKMPKITQDLRKLRITPNDYWIIAFIIITFIFVFLLNFSQILQLFTSLTILIPTEITVLITKIVGIIF